MQAQVQSVADAIYSTCPERYRWESDPEIAESDTVGKAWEKMLEALTGLYFATGDLVDANKSRVSKSG